MSRTETFYVRGRKPKTVINPLDNRHRFSPKIVTLIGHMTIHWSSLEFAVQKLLWILSENPEIGDILSRKLGMERWLEDIQLVARYRIADDDIIKSLQKIVTNIHKVQATRNNIVHGWLLATTEVSTIALFAKKPAGKNHNRRFAGGARIIKANELDKLIKDIHAVEAQLVQWEYTHVMEIAKSPRLPPLKHS